MFVDRKRAAREVVRVCRPGGIVLEHEFIYRKPPTSEIRQIFEREVCPGIRFDTAEDWIEALSNRCSEIGARNYWQV